jgi:hypothetical protein
MALKPKSLKAKPLDSVRSDIPVTEAAKENLARINFDVPESVRQRWKFAALEKNTTLAKMIIQAMNEYLSK